MSRGVPFAGANGTINPPPGDEGTVSPLPLFRSPGGANVSCWELDEEAMRTGRVFASVFSGRVFYPVFVSSERQVQRLVADTGPTFARDDTHNNRTNRGAIAFRISGAVLERAHELDGGLEVHVNGPAEVLVHVVPGDVAGVVATSLPIEVAAVRALVAEVEEFLDAEDRNAASSCGVLDKLAPIHTWLEAAEVAGGIPTRKHEA